MSEFKYDIGIVGIGRVGLPLALSLRRVGFRVLGFDRDPALLAALDAGRMPFEEPGCDELLTEHGLDTTSDLARVAEARTIIITVGTPVQQHLEADLDHITQALGSMVPHLRAGHAILLRSTVAPGTCLYIRRLLERDTGLAVPDEIALAYCPERLAEGFALRELRELPQIIGSWDAASAARAREIFGRLTDELLESDVQSAELAKLFDNVYRYVEFALANQFTVVAARNGAEIHEVLRLANRNYPRGGIKRPGFTAGTCLRKDFAMLSDGTGELDLFTAAWRANEYMPRYLVEMALERTDLHDRVVAVLGGAFKRDTDDVRDSLTPKLLRRIAREVPRELRLHDPHLSMEMDLEGVPNRPLQPTLRGADVVFIAVDHSAFARDIEQIAAALEPGVLVIDLWNVAGLDRVIYRAADLAFALDRSLRAAAGSGR